MLFTHTSRRIAALAFSASVITIAAACSSSSESPGKATEDGGSGSGSGSGGESNGSGGSDGTGSTGSGSGGVTGSGSGGSNLGGQTLGGLDGSVVINICGGDGCACSNGKDDDGDGQIDGFDTECTGPLDQDEGTFATGIPGDNVDPKWQDCFFDGNSGAGNDGCRYSTKCLTGELEQTDPDCVQKQNCINYCRDLTPNGCDCFGCCTIGAGTDAVNVVIQGTCSVEKLGDETACPRCVKSTTCNNTCGECELCPGKTVEDLPAKCTPPSGTGGAPGSGGAPGTGGAMGSGGTTVVDPPPNTCDEGQVACSLTVPCPSGKYCQQGCCITIIR
jgi:hypothetical protein